MFPPKIIGVLTYFPLESAFIRGAKKYLDIIEVRGDLIGDEVLIGKAVEKFSRLKPIILTVRSEKEGGVAIQNRKALYLKFLDSVDYIDVELSSLPDFRDVVSSAESKKKKVILSFHDFEGSANAKVLERKFSEFQVQGGDVFKSAVFARSKDELVELALFTRKISFKKRDFSVCVMCIGDPKISFLSRIVLPIFGSDWVYGRLGRIEGAPGQPDSFQLSKILKMV